MPDPPFVSYVVHFGAFEVDLRSAELRKHGLKVKIQEQPFQVLAMLLVHPGQLVTREEMRKKLWPADTFVDFEHGLNAAINKLREALGDSADNPRFVETMHRRGYRFIAPVEPLTPHLSPNGRGEQGVVKVGPSALERGGAEGLSVSPPSPSGGGRPAEPGPGAFGGEGIHESLLRRHRVVAAAGGLVAAVVAVLFAFNVAGLRERLLRHALPVPEIESIAVLPFENLSHDPEQEYFADGMTEELITNLGKISALRVISRTSVMQYKGTRKPLPQIARELNVDAIVEGTVQRSENRVRITANLLHAPTDRHLWAESYERDLRDVLTLQGEVARAIAREIQIKVTPQEQARLARAPTGQPRGLSALPLGTIPVEQANRRGFQECH